MSRPSPPLQRVGEHGRIASSSHYRPQPLNGSAIRHRHDAFGSSSRRDDDGPENGSPRRSIKARSKGTGNGKGKGKGRGKEKAKGRASWGSEQEEWVKEGFRRFGEHCARNQIRTLLIDCLVMTNLFYPSLALYLQKRSDALHSASPSSSYRMPLQDQAGPSRRIRRDHPLSFLSAPLLDTFFPYPPPLLPRLPWYGWWDASRSDDSREDEDGWRASRVGAGEKGIGGDADAEEEVRLLRVGWADVGDVLDGQGEAGQQEWTEKDDVVLSLVRDMVEQWEDDYPDAGEHCVRRLLPTNHDRHKGDAGPCYLVSPSSKSANGDWEGDDVLTLETLAGKSLVQGSGPNTNGSMSDTGSIYHSVAALFHVPCASAVDFESRWSSSLAQLAGKLSGEVFVEAHGPGQRGVDQVDQWSLSYHPHSSSSAVSPSDPKSPDGLSSSPPWAVWILYLLLFSVLGRQLSNASKVHSRFGLAFTGIVQLCCSSVMSFSVLALLGWNGWGTSSTPRTLPTYMLPFVIVIVGAENMSTLTRAVFSIPFTYSVPVRIGLALNKVGTTISLTSLTDLVLLFVVWLCVNLRPVREFCVFAAVVIITDWFMLHTFFLTILSIDAQRLELADVLAPPKQSAPSPTVEKTTEAEDGTRVAESAWRKVLRARSARVFSLFALLSSIGVLYYLTERHRSPHRTIANLYGYTPTQTSSTGSVSAPTAFSTAVTDLLSLSPSEALWRSLNPSGWPSVLLSVPPASLFVLPTPGHAMLPADLRKLSVKTSRLPLPRLRPLLYLLKVLVLPQAVTAGLLYILLLYLLKDADLLDAQRNRLGRGEVASDEGMDSSTGLPSITSRGRSQLAANLGVHMLPCSHAADLDLIASSKDVALVMSVGIDNTLCLWRFAEDGSVSGTRETLSAEGLRTSDPVVAALVGSDGRDLAVCTVSGTVQRWTISEEGAVVALPGTNIPSQARIVGFTFDDSLATTSSDDPFMARPVSPATTLKAPALLVACGNGEVFAVDATGAVSTIISASSSSTCKVFFLPANPGADVSLNIVVATAERVDCFRKTSAGWTSYGIQATLDASDRITAADRLVMGDAATTFVALGHRSGFVEIFDSEGSLLVTTDVVGEPIRSVRLSSPASSKCFGCAANLNEGLFVISSTISHVYVDRVHPRSAPICRCPQPRRSSSIEDLAHRDSATPSKMALSGSGPGLVVPPTSIRRSSPGNSPRKSPGLLPPVSNGEFPLSSHGTRRLSTMHRDDMSPRPPSPGERSPAMLFTPTTRHGHGHGHGHGGVSAASSGPSTWTDLEVTAMGGVRCTSGGAVLLGNHLDKVVGLRRFGSGIDEAGWQVWTLDLCSPWNGTMLVVERAPLDWLVRRTMTRRPTLSGSANEGETSMRDRRAERLLGLSGRASFTSQSQTNFGGGRAGGGGGGSASGSFAVPTHPGLAYVQVHPIVSRDPTSLVAGFGNRLGVVVLPESSGKDKSKFGSLNKTSGVSAATATSTTSATPATTAPAAAAVTAATATGGGGPGITLSRRSVGGLGIGGVQNAGPSGTQGITPPPPARRSVGDLHLQITTSDPPVSPVLPVGRTSGVGSGQVASNMSSMSSNGTDRKNI